MFCLFFFFSWGLVLSMWSKSAGEAGIRQPEGLVGGLHARTLGTRSESSGFAPALCFHTPQPYSLRLKHHHCATPPALHGQSCPVMQSHPPLSSHLVLCASASHFQQACVGSYCCCLADKHEKEKRQNVVVVLMSAKIQMLGGLSLPNQ